MKSMKRKRSKYGLEKMTQLKMPPLVKSSKIDATSALDDIEWALDIIGTRVAVKWENGIYEGIIENYDERGQLPRVFIQRR
mmetsp:Transcript_22837/g.31221  ORF Transcript_22837/g.31221 Transcript_22837/m.31221 type:complete len:81 (-) Transcript_22837:112-354(-)